MRTSVYICSLRYLQDQAEMPWRHHDGLMAIGIPGKLSLSVLNKSGYILHDLPILQVTWGEGYSRTYLGWNKEQNLLFLEQAAFLSHTPVRSICEGPTAHKDGRRGAGMWTPKAGRKEDIVEHQVTAAEPDRVAYPTFLHIYTIPSTE